jgi:hypothetical protein
MSITNAAVSGLAGAAALTLIHESARHTLEDAPRMEILGMRAIAYPLMAADKDVPDREVLFATTLAGDIVSNAAYYSLVGLARPENAVMTGALLGLAAGIGGVVLPGPMGLGTEPSARTPQTMAMTVAWYTLGGLAAGFTYSLLSNKKGNGHDAAESRPTSFDPDR